MKLNHNAAWGWGVASVSLIFLGLDNSISSGAIYSLAPSAGALFCAVRAGLALNSHPLIELLPDGAWTLTWKGGKIERFERRS